MSDRYKQKAETHVALAALPVAGEVHHVVGSTATLLTRPAGMTMLVLAADKGNWRFRMGDRTSAGMPAAFQPAATVSDGSGAFGIREGARQVFTAAALSTVKGYNADDVLTYYWL